MKIVYPSYDRTYMIDKNAHRAMIHLIISAGDLFSIHRLFKKLDKSTKANAMKNAALEFLGNSF